MKRIYLLAILIFVGCAPLFGRLGSGWGPMIEWKRVIVQNARLGWLSAGGQFQIETDGLGRYCLRERVAEAPTHWSDCVANTRSLKDAKAAAEARRIESGSKYPWH